MRKSVSRLLSCVLAVALCAALALPALAAEEEYKSVTYTKDNVTLTIDKALESKEEGAKEATVHAAPDAQATVTTAKEIKDGTWSVCLKVTSEKETLYGLVDKDGKVAEFLPQKEMEKKLDAAKDADTYLVTGSRAFTLAVPEAYADYVLSVCVSVKDGKTTEFALVLDKAPTEPAAPGEPASTFAQEVAAAIEKGLLPDSLKEQDLKQNITRAQFAALSVKLYEAMSGEKAEAPAENPFTDTEDAEVLKAYALGITNGLTADTFGGDSLLTRGQACAMLTRVYKKVTMEKWTLADDAKFPLTYEKPAAFDDDAKIGDNFKESVYFLVANQVINGTGNNLFSPDDNAQAQVALVIAGRMLDNLKK